MKKKAKRIAKILRNDSLGVVAQMIVDDFLGDSYDIYTDGACKGGVGGCGWVILHKGVIRKCGRACFLSTNNDSVEAELRAVLHSLEDCPTCISVDVYLDCQTVIRKFELGKIGEFASIYNKVKRDKMVRFHWVRAHCGNIFNELVDMLAFSSIDAKISLLN